MSTTLQAASQDAIRKAHAILGHEKFQSISKCIEQYDSSALAEIFEEFISDAIREEPNDLEQLVDARVCFEQSACLSISGEEAICESLLNGKGAELLDEMEKIATSSQGLAQDFEQFHQLDCEFHCLLADLGSIASVVTIVRALDLAQVAYGQPSSVDEMRTLHLEHLQIVQAIESRKKNEIHVAVRNHIRVAFSRWLTSYCMEAKKMSLLDGPSQYQAEIDSMVEAIQSRLQKELTPIQLDRIRWEVEFKNLYPNQYVVYRIETVEKDEVIRQVRDVLAHSGEWNEIVAFTEINDELDPASVRVDHYAA